MKTPILIFAALLLLYPACTAGAAEQVDVVCNISTIENYNKFVMSRGGDPFAITDFKSPYVDRPVVNLLIIAQALHEGGLDFSFNFIVSPNPGRSITEVKKGNAVIYQADMWESTFDNSVYKSMPIILRGQFQKGFYVNRDSPLLHDIQTVEHLKSIPLLIETTWLLDIKTLEENGFQHIVTVPKYEKMLQMVALGRGEMTFLEFPNTDGLIRETRHGELVPIPGIKIIFHQSRHFMVSKKHPKGKQVFTALQAGLKILRQKGIIVRAQVEAGVVNPQVEHWLPLNSHNVEPQ